MRVRLVVHTILRGVGGLRFPFCVVGDLAVCSERPVFILLVGVDNSPLGLEIGFRGGHPISREVGLAFRSTVDLSCWSRGSATTSSAATTARPLPRCCAAALCRLLAGQYLAENQNHRQPEHDG